MIYYGFKLHNNIEEKQLFIKDTKYQKTLLALTITSTMIIKRTKL